MKKIQFISIMFISLLIAFSSCSKESNTVPPSATTSSILVKGNWRVTYFNDSGTDGTANYNGFKFLFIEGGSVVIFNDLLSIYGTWSTYSDDGRNNLLLNFAAILSSTAALNHDWHIVEKTSVKLRMEDVSGGGSGTDYLTIEKI